jgi:UDP-N-acetylmuramyl pentapeptide phosphotransferase/UDP-N-acetylglucosamine-1-phosphate transferase
MAYVDGGFQNANGVYVPLFPSFIELPPVLWIVIAVVAITGMSNAVNLTEWLDGLSGIITASASSPTA